MTTIVSDDEETVDRWLGVESFSDEESFDDFTDFTPLVRPKDGGSRKDSHPGRFSALPRSSTPSPSAPWSRFVEEDVLTEDGSRFMAGSRSTKTTPATCHSTNRGSTSSQSARPGGGFSEPASREILVDVIGGVYKGKIAIFVKETEKRVGVVFRSNPGSVRYLDRANVRFCKEEGTKPPSAQLHKIPDTVLPPRQPDNPITFEPGAVVEVIGGKYKGQTATVVKQNEQRVGVIFKGDQSSLRFLAPKNLRLKSMKQAGKTTETPVFIVDCRREGSSSCRTKSSDNSKGGCSKSTTHPNSDISQHIKTTLQSSNQSLRPEKIGPIVDIVGGTHKGKVARLVKRTEKRVCVVFNEDFAFVRYLNPSNVRVRSGL